MVEVEIRDAATRLTDNYVFLHTYLPLNCTNIYISLGFYYKLYIKIVKYKYLDHLHKLVKKDQLYINFCIFVDGPNS